MLCFKVFSYSVDAETTKAASWLICHAFLVFLESSFSLWNHPHPAPWRAKHRICPLCRRGNISLWKKAGTALLAPLSPLHPLPLRSLSPRCVCCHCTAVYASRGSPCSFQYSFLPLPCTEGCGYLAEISELSWPMAVCKHTCTVQDLLAPGCSSCRCMWLEQLVWELLLLL